MKNNEKKEVEKYFNTILEECLEYIIVTKTEKLLNQDSQELERIVTRIVEKRVEELVSKKLEKIDSKKETNGEYKMKEKRLREKTEKDEIIVEYNQELIKKMVPINLNKEDEEKVYALRYNGKLMLFKVSNDKSSKIIVKVVDF